MLALYPDRVFDGVGTGLVPGPVVVDQDGSIMQVGPAGELGAEVERLLLPGVTLLPGLIDCHVHLTGFRSWEEELGWLPPAPLRAARAAADLRALLEAGFTTVREVGGDLGLHLKRALAEGSIPGPRLLSAGRWIEPTGGADDLAHIPLALARSGGIIARLADGPVEVRTAVREQLREGADLIKTATTGSYTNAASDMDALEWTDEELAALVDEAHRHGRRVAVHADTLAGIRQAIRFGADTIEHGTFIDRTLADEMANVGVALVPTVAWLDLVDRRSTGESVPEWVARAGRWADDHAASLRVAASAGVPLAMGTSCSGRDVFPHGTNALELEMMVRLGVDAAASLVAATSGAARALGLDAVGALRPGMVADVVGTPGNPLEEITHARDISFVMQGGRIVVDRTSATAAATPHRARAVVARATT